MGAVATTLMAGVELVRKGRRQPVGSFTQLGTIPGRNGKQRPVAEALKLPTLNSVVFGGVDLIERNAYTGAATAGVLNQEDLKLARRFLTGIKAGPGIHDPVYVRTLEAMHTLPQKNKFEQAEAMKRNFRAFFRANKCSRMVVVLTISTEAWRELAPVHASQESFIKGLHRNDPEISPSQIYVWAALQAGFPVVNCTPNLILEVPALQSLALERGLPMAGSDLKSGQTLMKTVVGAALGKRLLGVKGWFSTNILGNRDGLVLHAPENFRAKEITKGGVLDDLLDVKAHPELYRDLVHQVHIHYFPPKGDNKEAWDAIQLFGWLGYEMELKLNFECRDSILAAPLVLDLALLLDAAARRGEKGTQSWLGGYFKHPAVCPGERVCNDLHIQLSRLDEQLRKWL
jgi:myo-inositol-1-phosphate synthase